MKTIDVAAANTLSPGELRGFDAQGTKILVANVEGNYYAMNGLCTHRKGDLSKGKLEGRIVTCLKHGSQFDVTTGEAILGPKIALLRLKTDNEPIYKVKVEGGRILVDI